MFLHSKQLNIGINKNQALKTFLDFLLQSSINSLNDATVRIEKPVLIHYPLEIFQNLLVLENMETNFSEIMMIRRHLNDEPVFMIRVTR